MVGSGRVVRPSLVDLKAMASGKAPLPERARLEKVSGLLIVEAPQPNRKDPNEHQILPLIETVGSGFVNLDTVTTCFLTSSVIPSADIQGDLPPGAR